MNPIDFNLSQVAAMDYSKHVVQFKDVNGPIEDEADVVVIGTGAGGAACADALVASGLKVIAVEAGGYYPLKYLNQNLLDMMSLLSWQMGNAGSKDGSLRMVHGKCVGGSTLLHMLTMTAIPDDVLGRWQKKYGLTKLNRQRLTPIESQLRKKMNIKEIPAERINDNAKRWIAGCEKLGVYWKANERNAGNCIEAGKCHTGCPFGGKLSMDTAIIPNALNHGLKLYTDCKVDRIITSDGKATGVAGTFRNRTDGKVVGTLTLKAKKIVVAAGTIQTPALLLRSDLQNKFGTIGASLHAQPAINILGEFNDEIHGWRGITNPLHIDEWAPLEKGGFFCEPGLLEPSIYGESIPFMGAEHESIMSRYKYMAGGQVLLNDDGTGGTIGIDGDGNPEVQYELSENDKQRMRVALKKMGEILFAAGAKAVYLSHRIPLHLNSVKDLAKLDDIPLGPNDAHLETVHAQGSCKMSLNPEDGVVDEKGELHNVKDLYLADCSIFPDGVGTNTTIPGATMGIYVAEEVISSFPESH